MFLKPVLCILTYKNEALPSSSCPTYREEGTTSQKTPWIPPPGSSLWSPCSVSEKKKNRVFGPLCVASFLYGRSPLLLLLLCCSGDDGAATAPDPPFRQQRRRRRRRRAATEGSLIEGDPFLRSSSSNGGALLPTPVTPTDGDRGGGLFFSSLSAALPTTAAAAAAATPRESKGKKIPRFLHVSGALRRGIASPFGEVPRRPISISESGVEKEWTAT